MSSILADSWPMQFDDSNARKDWGWRHEYDTERLCQVMFDALIPKYRNVEKIQAHAGSQA